MCIDNFIGIRACQNEASPAPRSGLYLDDLAGLSVANVAQVSNDSSGFSLMNKAIEFAAKTVANEAFSLIPSITLVDVADYLSQGVFNDYPFDSIAGLNGIKYEKEKVSPLSRLMLNTIYLKSNTTATKDVLIYDGGELVKTLTGVEVFVGKTKRLDNIALKIQSDTLEIKWDTSDIETFTAKQNKCCIGPLSCNCNGKSPNKFISVSDGVGVTAEVAIVCDKPEMSCRVLDSLKYAILYRAGMQVLDEWMATDRLNFLAVNKQEWAIATRAEWEREYIEKTRIAVRNDYELYQKIDKHCFKCTSPRSGFITKF
jgi:hypothetical protein